MSRAPLAPDWLPDPPVVDVRPVLAAARKADQGWSKPLVWLSLVGASALCIGQAPLAILTMALCWKLAAGATPGLRLPRLVRGMALLGALVGVAVTPLAWKAGVLLRVHPPPMLLPAYGAGMLVGFAPVAAALLLELHLRRQFGRKATTWVTRLLLLLVLVGGWLWMLQQFLLAPFPPWGASLDAFASGLTKAGLAAVPLGAALVGLAGHDLSMLAPTTDARLWLERLDMRTLGVEERPWGLHGSGELDGVPIEVALVETSIPPRLAFRVPVPGLPETVRIEARASGSEPSLDDPVLGRLIAVQGLAPEQAPSLVEDLHEELLSVVRGRPGSRVEQGAVVLVAPLDPLPDARWPEPKELAAEAVTLALALQARLDSRKIEEIEG